MVFNTIWNKIIIRRIILSSNPISLTKSLSPNAMFMTLDWFARNNKRVLSRSCYDTLIKRKKIYRYHSMNLMKKYLKRVDLISDWVHIVTQLADLVIDNIFYQIQDIVIYWIRFGDEFLCFVRYLYIFLFWFSQSWW